MTLYELYQHAPLCFIFVRGENGKLREYKGAAAGKNRTVATILATDYPMFKHVLEVTLDK